MGDLEQREALLKAGSYYEQAPHIYQRIQDSVSEARLRATSIRSGGNPKDIPAATADPMECPGSIGPESPPLARWAHACTA